jgi:hypothetical protein
MPNNAINRDSEKSLEEMERTLSRLAKLRVDCRIDKVLVDSRTRTGQPPAADLYRGGTLLAERLGPWTRVAVLVERIEPDHTLFQTALRWLLK